MISLMAATAVNSVFPAVVAAVAAIAAAAAAARELFTRLAASCFDGIDFTCSSREDKYFSLLEKENI